SLDLSCGDRPDRAQPDPDHRLRRSPVGGAVVRGERAGRRRGRQSQGGDSMTTSRAGQPPACRSCGAPLTETFVDLGVTPLANSYLASDEEAATERAYPLHARVC